MPHRSWRRGCSPETFPGDIKELDGVRISGRTAGVADISLTSQSGSEKPPRGIPGTGLHRCYFPAHFSWLHQPRCVMQQAGVAAESWSWGQPSEAVLHCVQNR